MSIYQVIGYMVLLVFQFSNRALAVHGEYPCTDTSFVLPGSLNEKVMIMTDRHIYAVGEKILFAGINIPPPELKASCWSKVLYLELLTPGGTSTAQGTFPMSCSRASGYLTIPDYFRLDLSVNLEGNLKSRKIGHSYSQPIITLSWNFKLGNYASD
jgi:hypothetical protein